MLASLYILFEVIFIGAFVLAYYQKHELPWAVTLMLGSLQMFSSYYIETMGYVWDASINAYKITSYAMSSPYLMAINLLFFALAVILCIFDLFEKYGIVDKLKWKNGF